MNKLQWRAYQYYVLIGLASLISMFVFPFIGSQANLSLNLPNSTAGWIVYVITKLIVAAVSFLIFHCFMEQAKLNVSQNQRYKEAQQILLKAEDKDQIPVSPKVWIKKQYSSKGFGTFMTSLLGSIGLTQAVLTFDWMSLITYTITVIASVGFGFIQMKQMQVWWTTQYWRWAIYTKEQEQLKQKTQITEESENTHVRN